MKLAVINCSRRQLQWRTHLLCLSAALLFFVPWASAQTDAILPAIGGNGGSQFHARCAQGQHLTGFELRVGDDVDAIRPICVTAYGPSETGTPEPYPSRFGGNGGGADVQLVCPKDSPIVVAMYVRSEGVATIIVNNIHLYCGVAAATQTLSQYPSAVYDGPRANKTSGPFGLGGSPVRFDSVTQRCPPGLVAVGINGRSGIWLDALGLICGAPKLTHAPVRPQGRVRPTPPEGIKPQGRVRSAPGTVLRPPLAICDLARQARARNSPAARGQEEKCRADLAAKGAVIAHADSSLAGPRNAEPDPLYRQGFDIATALFGNPALGALGNTATGPGSLGIRDSLSAAGQRGFNASVELHLKRDYKRPSGPSITIRESVGTDPVTVYTRGMTQMTVNVSWNAGPDYTYCEIYLSVDNGQWSEFARGRDGAKSAAIKLGSSHIFRMMIYEGQQGTPKIIKTLTVNGVM